MTVAPLVDTYNPTCLAFNAAVPPPDLVDSARGVLTWTDLTVWTGDVPPHASISVTTVFTALAATEDSMNRAEVVGASDWYGNEMGGGADEVPITIIGPTPTPVPTATPRPKPKDTPAPTATPTPVTPTPTLTPVAPLLPETGNAGRGVGRGLAAVLLVLGAGVALLVRARRRVPPPLR